MKFECIFFDSGGTLYGPGDDADVPPGEVASGSSKRVHALLGGMGIDLDISRLEKAVERQTEVCRNAMGPAYNFFRLMEAVVKELRLPLGPEDAACLADAYAGPRYASWLFPGTREALCALWEQGCRLGVIANTAWPGFCMDRAFAGVGLLPFLSIRIYSGDIGIEKPSPAIFRLAERIGGLEGKRILFVGNEIEMDIRGAAAVGWSTAFRRTDGHSTNGLADFEFDHISELVRYCINP